MPITPSRTRAAVAAAAGGMLSLGLVACGGSSGSAGSPPSSASSASSASSSSAASSESPESASQPLTESPVGDTSSPTEVRGHQCVDIGASWCDDFERDDSGWDTRTGTLVAGYNGGFYTLASAEPGILRATAPVDTTTFSPTYRVQMKVKATIAGTPTTSAKVGFTCWERPTSDGNGTAGFVLSVSPVAVRIGIWSVADGRYHDIATKARVQRSSSMELTAQCVQNAGTAFLGLQIDGVVALTTNYAMSTSNYEWEPTGKVGVLVGGGGAGKTVSVAYDDFELRKVREQ